MNSPIEHLLDTVQYEDIEVGENISNGTLYAIKKGTIVISGFSLAVYVLNNGERVFDANDFENFLIGKQNE